jgi:hypothetical protein
MQILVDKATTFLCNLGKTRTSWDVSYRILNSSLAEISTWTSSCVSEIGNGYYGVAITLSSASVGYIEWKAEKSGETDIYLVEEFICVEDYISKIASILKIETGKWKILSNQFIIYDTNGTTPLYTFNLKDSSGNPTETNVYERDPV